MLGQSHAQDNLLDLPTWGLFGWLVFRKCQQESVANAKLRYSITMGLFEMVAISLCLNFTCPQENSTGMYVMLLKAIQCFRKQERINYTYLIPTHSFSICSLYIMNILSLFSKYVDCMEISSYCYHFLLCSIHKRNNKFGVGIGI